MKANNLQGDYCQTCASILDEAQRNFRPVVILDSQCASVFRSSGDAERFNVPKREAQEQPAPAPEPKAETPKRKEPETHKPAKKVGRR
jgi:hypothetical protein